MEKVDQLLDLLDAWDELPTMQRPIPAEFCKEHPELLEDFCQVLRNRAAVEAALAGSQDIELTPQAMMDSIAPDRYGLLHFHDQGGIGWVYVAKDSEVDRKVALKCLQPQAAIDPEARSRFFREAAITSALEHPGVVPIYGVGGNAPEQTPYYAMRFVQGTTMREAIRQLHASPVEKWTTGPANQLLRNLINVCNTVSFAHSRNIIHRDLKSANIMLGEYGETLLLDWGLAKRVDDPNLEPSSQSPESKSDDSLHATRSGSTIGTIAFMSPEQALGKWDEVDFQSDLFSLGAILFQILTGQVPYRGPQSLLLAQRAEYATPASIMPSTPPALNAICCKAMALKKSDRYASVDAFRKDLESFLADEPIIARPDNILSSSQRWLRKHRAVAQVSGFLLVASTLILMGFLARLTEQNEKLERSVESEKQAKRDIEDRNLQIKSLLVESQKEAHQAQMMLVSQSWNGMHPKKFEQSLFNAQPKVGSLIDPRGPEWWLAWHRAFGEVTPTALDFADDPIVAIRLVADSQRAAIWTRSRRLKVIDLTTRIELFSAILPTPANMLTIWSSDDIPISEDGSTIAIADQASIQLWKWDGQTYVAQKSSLNHPSYTSHWVSLYLSANGETIAALNQSKEVAIWKNNATQVKLPWNNYRAERIALSQNGNMVAMLQDMTVSIMRLDTEELKEFKNIFDAAPTKILFSELNTLIAWNKRSARTWYINSAPFEATHLWDYPLPPPPVGAFEWACLRERIVFENGFRVDRVGPVPNTLVDRGRVRASLLACIDETDSRVLVREPAKSFALTEELPDPSLLKDRIRELPIPHSSQLQSFTSNFNLAAMKISEEHWAICNLQNQLQWLNDPFFYRGPVHQLSWLTDSDLVAVSAAASFPPFVAHGPGDLTQPELAKVTCGSSIVNSRSLELKGYQSCVSENGRVAASYEKKSGIHLIDTRSNEPKKPFEVDATIGFSGDRAIQMYLWNRWEQGQPLQTKTPEIDFDLTRGPTIKKASPPLDLPWLLMFQNGSWGNPMDDVLDERLQLLVIDYQDRSQVSILEIDDDKVVAAAIAPDGRHMAVATEGSQLHIWSVGDDRKIAKLAKLPLPSVVTSLNIQPPLNIYAGTERGDILSINEQLQIDVWSQDAHDGRINGLTISPDSSRLISLGDDNYMRMFATADRREVFSLAMTSTPTCASFSPKQTCLAVGEESGRVQLFPLATSDQVIEFEQRALKASWNPEHCKETIARELWAGTMFAFPVNDVLADSIQSTIESLETQFSERSVQQLRAKVLEEMQHTP